MKAKEIFVESIAGIQKHILIERDDESYLTFPADPANTDYQEYLRWLAEGGVPLPAEEITQ